MYYKISRDVISDIEISFLSEYNMRAEDKLLQKSIKILINFLFLKISLNFPLYMLRQRRKNSKSLKLRLPKMCRSLSKNLLPTKSKWLFSKSMPSRTTLSRMKMCSSCTKKRQNYKRPVMQKLASVRSQKPLMPMK